MSKRPPFHRIDGPIRNQLLIRTPDWMIYGVCSGDPEMFFPDPGDRAAITHAKRVCSVCPVKSDCFEYAFTNREPFGIWGGATEDERNRLLGRTPRRDPVSFTCSTCGKSFESGRARSGHELIHKNQMTRSTS